MKVANADSLGQVILRRWRSSSTTKALLVGAGIAAAVIYVLGRTRHREFIDDGDRPYSFMNQWISELTAIGSPVRPLMVGIITVHDLLLIAFGLGIWRVAAQQELTLGCRHPDWGVGLRSRHPSVLPDDLSVAGPSFHGHLAWGHVLRMEHAHRRNRRIGRCRVPGTDEDLLGRDSRNADGVRTGVRNRHQRSPAERHAVGRGVRTDQCVRADGLVHRPGVDRDSPPPGSRRLEESLAQEPCRRRRRSTHSKDDERVVAPFDVGTPWIRA